MGAHPWTDHYEIELVHTCQCDICTNWRAAMAKVQAIQASITDHRTFCRCDKCREYSAAAFTLRAATNKLDVVCEVAYHATHNAAFKPFQASIMDRLMEVITSSEWQDGNLWGREGGELPLAYWLRRAAFTPQTSGAFAVV